MSSIARDSNISYRNLFKTMTQGVVYQDSEGKIISANPAAEKILGLTFDQMTGRTSMDPRWKTVHEDGSDFPGENHPSMVALKTGNIVKDVIMGIFNPAKETYQWINVNAVPEYRDGERKPYQVYTTFEDITERKQAAEAYRNLVQSSPMGMHFYELQDHDRLVFIGANPSADRLLGVDHQAFIGKTIEEAFPPLSQTEVPKRYRQAARQGIPWETEQIDYQDDQIVGAFEVRAFRIAPNKMAAEFTEITHRKKVEKALKDSEERYRLITENVDDVIWTMDMNFNFTYISPSIFQLRGYTVEEALKQPLEETILTDSLVMIMDLVNQKLMLIESGDDEGWSPVIFEAEQYHKDGTLIWSHNNARFLPGPDDKPASILGVTRNITQRKESEKALKKSEKLYRTLFEKTTNAIFIIERRTGRFLDANEAAIRLSGRRLSGLKQLTTQDVSPDESREQLDIIAKSNKIEELGKVAFKRPDGTHRVATLTTVPSDSEAIICIARDITDELEMENQLRQAQKMEAIGTLAGGIAHDFNNILFPLFGYAEMLKEDLPADSPLQGHVDGIIRAALRSKNLVKQILVISRQGDQDIKPIKLQPIAKEALKLLRSSIPTTIKFQQDIDPDCGVVVTDPTQIHQVILNLATNAYHAMEDSGGRLNVRLKQIRQESADQSIVPELTPGDYARLTVTDTGVGIQKNVMSKIFDPYFTTKETGKGTGLGLSVVQGIVKSCNGDIHIKSEPGIGTEVHVYLPIMDRKADDKPTDRNETIQGGSEKILLVDDEEAIVRMEQQMLKRLGYRVTSYTGSIEALEAFKAAPDSVDLIVTDMTMPNMTGVQLAGEIIKVRSDIPIILCTGFSYQVDDEKSKALGIKGFVMKPVTMKVLAETIRKALDDSKEG